MAEYEEDDTIDSVIDDHSDTEDEMESSPEEDRSDEDCSEDLTLSVTPHTVVFKCMGTTKDPQRQAALCMARDRISNGRRRQSKSCEDHPPWSA